MADTHIQLSKDVLDRVQGRRVMMAMSGGVDSSVSAALLIDAGADVVGVFMKNWDDCDWRAERRDAMRVAAQLDIPFRSVDFEQEYREHVYQYMLDEYKAGRTPNPDVLCNKYMKFGFLLKEADRLGCDLIATGHYAQTAIDDDGSVHLIAGKDKKKDQSYFLCRLNQAQLQRAVFPIGHLDKSHVREIAKQQNLIVADKKDSQGICFVGKVDLAEFLQTELPPEEGDIVSTKGGKLGTHKGHMYYTIGQRHGLGIGGGDPYYVVERRPDTNEVVVGHEDDPALFSSTLRAVELTEVDGRRLLSKANAPIQARIRYRQPLQGCQFSVENGYLKVEFSEPQRAVAPGQFIAFYIEDELLGSAIIESA